MSWAVDSWTEVEARAVMLGLTARIGGPDSVLDLDARHFLALLEGILREDDGRRKQVNDLYAASVPAPKAPANRGERNREIARLSRLFGG
ncbi:hypothetical protein JNUCC0626_18215 [Lentzea sp. JNUCC 0626]|uniref:hypothetical protein n=1 Tax=Lentzea sp. JNUCC 0626 TaxID=3367513 RepID=UPI00374A6A16